MNKILPQSNIFNMILDKQNYDSKIEYRPFKYVIKQDIDSTILLYNVLTSEMISLTRQEFDDDTFYKYLVENYYMVPTDFDDYKFYKECYKLSLSFDCNNSVNNYVIMPTMECNARCFYCFEHGSKRYPMSLETASDVAEYIIKKANGKPIKIQWFGGEPLFNKPVIDIITKKLRAAGNSFKSIMISNGILFSDNVVECAKKEWNLESVQITLDGTEKIYNKIKSYIYTDIPSPFLLILDNIERLLKSKITVIVRLNIDKHNYEDMYELVDLLFDRFKTYKENFTVYSWLLYDNRGQIKSIKSDIERQDLTRKLIDFEKYIESKGLSTKSMPPKEMKLYSCWADDKSSAVILPNGNLGRCDHHSDDEIYGNIYSDKIDNDVILSWRKRRKSIELCKNCPLVPQCLHLEKCPDDGAYDCDVFEQEKRMRRLLLQIKNAYNRYRGV